MPLEISRPLSSLSTLRRMVPPRVLATLVAEITSATQGEHHVAELGAVVADSAEAFVAAGGAPEAAARSVSPRLHLLGVSQAEHGVDSAELDRAFQRAETAALVGTRRLLGPQLRRDPLQSLLQAISVYVRALHACAHTGLQRAGHLRELGAEQRHQAMIHALFGADDPIDAFLATNRLDMTAEYVPVIAVGAPLPSCLRHARTLVGSPFEVLVPASELKDQLAEATTGSPRAQLLVGPPSPLAASREGLRLTRAAADLVRTKAVVRAEPVVSCLDLVAGLTLSRSAVLGEMAVEKHLDPLMKMPLGRRVHYADLLLRWLEQGRPLAHVAADISLPAQTAHHRLSVMRDLFGDKLERPESRLELVIALHCALPAWLDEQYASASRIPPRRRSRSTTTTLDARSKPKREEDKHART